MKVSELIERLESLDKDAIVVVIGYEGGYDNVGTKEIFIKLDCNSDTWYYGRHCEAGEGEEGAVKAVLLRLEGNK
jgi:hypothetical protein